mmetsp:Transcript_87741/g.233527  ORF Transcript_87741/g.233527 Transcript_87741/m.233527 type:complete len:88 (-) Transcript_87741:204-467(-)
MALVSVKPKEDLPRCIAQIIQKDHNVLVDALPYIDKEFDQADTKDLVERLIDEEMESFEPSDYLSMLPPVPSLRLPRPPTSQWLWSA